jgi:uncharacterized protein YlaI
MMRCNVCKEGIAEHRIIDTRDWKEKLEYSHGQWVGDMYICDHCKSKMDKKIEEWIKKSRR